MEATVKKANEKNMEYFKSFWPTYIVFKIIDTEVPEFYIYWTGNTIIKEDESKTVQGRIERVDVYEITQKELNAYVVNYEENTTRPIGYINTFCIQPKLRLNQRRIADLDKELNAGTFIGYWLHNELVEVKSDEDLKIKSLPLIDAFGLENTRGYFWTGLGKTAPEKILINFEPASWEMPKDLDSNYDIQLLIRYLNQFDHQKILVIGHTDSDDIPMGNQTLSENRAKAFKEYLSVHVKNASDRITCEGKGDKYPIGDNTTEEGKKENRRVEIRYLK